MDDEEKLLLQIRTGIVTDEETATLCLHHKQVYIHKYSFQQNACCDPKKRHKSQVRKKSSLKSLGIDDAAYVSAVTGASVKPGQKLCWNCFASIKKDGMEGQSESDPEPEDNPNDVELDKIANDYEVDTLNRSFADSDISPLKPSKISDQNMSTYAKRKLSQYESALPGKMAKLLDVDHDQLMKTKEPQPCSNCKDMDQLVQLVKDKMNVSPNHKQLQLLTLAPESWSIEKTVKEFNVSEYKVKQARQLKKDHGILADPKPKVGRKLSKQIEEKVTAFYQNDEHSRQLPGKKDCKSVKGPDGKRKLVQKRLLLLNLNELYENYKAKYPEDKIGRSKFCALRPPQCITVGCRGSHSVCVCTIHQNVKLMLSVLPTNEQSTILTYYDLMGKLVCSLDSKLCMIHRCRECPGAEGLTSYLETLCELQVDDTDEVVYYKQWVTVDRTTLQDYSKPLDEFIENLVEKLDNLTSHHFIAKHQSRYLTSLKEELPPNEAVLILDFAENYSFIVQDAAQGYHWDNSQATLHPFVAYVQQDGKIEHICMCVISNHLKHDTVTVYSFLKVIIPYLKESHSQIEKIHYFSDGAASQYKNYKNLCNLLFHYVDFSLEAEWNFFATSHGKNACDGVGGTVKREAARASLQATTTGHILTPRDLFNWASNHIKNVKFFFVSKEDVAANVQQQEMRFHDAKTVAGTRSHHSYRPHQDGRLIVKRVSSCNETAFEAVVYPDSMATSARSDPKRSVELHHCEIGKYVACIFDDKWWIGLIRDASEEEGDVLISFMHPHGPAALFHWPRREDMCHVPLQCILRIVITPTTPNGRQYYIDNEDRQAIVQLLLV